MLLIRQIGIIELRFPYIYDGEISRYNVYTVNEDSGGALLRRALESVLMICRRTKVLITSKLIN